MIERKWRQVQGNVRSDWLEKLMLAVDQSTNLYLSHEWWQIKAVFEVIDWKWRRHRVEPFTNDESMMSVYIHNWKHWSKLQASRPACSALRLAWFCADSQLCGRHGSAAARQWPSLERQIGATECRRLQWGVRVRFTKKSRRYESTRLWKNRVTVDIIWWFSASGVMTHDHFRFNMMNDDMIWHDSKKNGLIWLREKKTAHPGSWNYPLNYPGWGEQTVQMPADFEGIPLSMICKVMLFLNIILILVYI